MEVVLKNESKQNSPFKLFFINLGGYKQNEFEEFHYKMIIAAADKAEAVNISKQTAFFKHTGFKGATAHIDDKFGVDVDDVYEITDILPAGAKEKYSIIGNSLQIHLLKMKYTWAILSLPCFNNTFDPSIDLSILFFLIFGLCELFQRHNEKY